MIPPPIAKPPVRRWQKNLAILVALLADGVQLGFFWLFFAGGASPPDDLVDFLTALLLCAICGFKWQFLIAFFFELLPGFDLFPTWTAVAATLPVTDAAHAPGVRIHVVPPRRAARQHPPIDVSATAIPPIQKNNQR